MKKKAVFHWEGFGHVDLYLEDLTEVAQIMRQILPAGSKERVQIDCADHELTDDEIPQLEGRTCDEVEMKLDGLSVTFGKHARAFVYDKPIDRGLAVQIHSYLERHCRPAAWWRRSYERQSALVAVATLVAVIGFSIFLSLGFGVHVPFWVMMLSTSPLSWLLIGLARRPDAIVHLVPRPKNLQWWARHREPVLVLAGIAGTLAAAVLTVWLTHVWK